MVIGTAINIYSNDPRLFHPHTHANIHFQQARTQLLKEREERELLDVHNTLSISNYMQITESLIIKRIITFCSNINF